MEIVIALGPETSDDAVQVTVSDEDQRWSPDQLDDACRRAADTALRCYHDLHPVPAVKE